MIVACIILILLPLSIFGGRSHGTDSGCKYPYVPLESNCYYFSRDKVSWDDAYVNCIHKGGYLANFETLDEYLLVRYKLTEMKAGSVYSIGARDFKPGFKSGDWRWVKRGNNTKLSYTVFGPHEPNGSKARPEYCMILFSGTHFAFADYPCSYAAQYICEKK